MRGDTANAGNSRSAGCAPLTMFLVSLLVVAGVKLVRSGQGSVMQKGALSAAMEGNDPFLPLVAVAVALTAVIAVLLMTARKRNRGVDTRECTDFTHVFDRPAGVPHRPPAAEEPPPFEGEMLVPDASVSEVAELGRELEAQGIRFFTRQTVIDNAFHWLGNGGMGTRMCIFVHPDDTPFARLIVAQVLKAPAEAITPRSQERARADEA